MVPARSDLSVSLGSKLSIMSQIGQFGYQIDKRLALSISECDAQYTCTPCSEMHVRVEVKCRQFGYQIDKRALEVKCRQFGCQIDKHGLEVKRRQFGCQIDRGSSPPRRLRADEVRPGSRTVSLMRLSGAEQQSLKLGTWWNWLRVRCNALVGRKCGFPPGLCRNTGFCAVPYRSCE